MSDEPPDEAKAMPIIQKYYVGSIIEDEDGKKIFKKFSCGDSIEEYQRFGEGTYMYFYFLKYFSILFCILGLLMLVPIIFMILEKGNHYEAGTNFFFKTMLANIPSLRKDEISNLLFILFIILKLL